MFAAQTLNTSQNQLGLVLFRSSGNAPLDRRACLVKPAHLFIEGREFAKGWRRQLIFLQQLFHEYDRSVWTKDTAESARNGRHGVRATGGQIGCAIEQPLGSFDFVLLPQCAGELGQRTDVLRVRRNRLLERSNRCVNLPLLPTIAGLLERGKIVELAIVQRASSGCCVVLSILRDADDGFRHSQSVQSTHGSHLHFSPQRIAKTVKSAQTLLQEARQQWLADEHEVALDLLRQAMTAEPQDLRLAVEVASYLGMRFEVAEAVEILGRCEPLLQNDAEAIYQVGLAYDRCYRPDDALRCFKRTVQCSANHAKGWVSMAEWHERRGQLQAAWNCLKQYRPKADRGEVQLWRAKLLRRMQDADAAESTLVSLLGTPTIESSTRIAAWYELAELYDRQGEADKAIEAATAAKQLQRPSVLPHVQTAQSLARVEVNFVKTVSNEHYARWQDDVSHPPIALLTGPPRSGTTLAARMLGTHSRLAVSDELEVYPTYIHKEMLAGREGSSAGEVLDSLDDRHLAQCRERYLRWISAAVGQSVGEGCLLDKFPSTTFLIPPWRRLFPHMLVVMALRDPRDVVISCFLRHLALNPVSAMFSRLDWAVMRCRAEWLAWLELRDKLAPPWFEVRYEDVVAGDHSSLHAILKSLGLARQGGLDGFQSALETTPARSPTYAQLGEPINARRVGHWRRYRKHLEPHLPPLDEIANALGYE